MRIIIEVDEVAPRAPHEKDFEEFTPAVIGLTVETMQDIMALAGQPCTVDIQDIDPDDLGDVEDFLGSRGRSLVDRVSS